MHSTHREMEILDELKVSGSCRIQDLARRLAVSEETIRRNVKKLAVRGLVRKVHGGVYLPDAVQEASFAQRMDENPDAKRLIAGQLAQLIKDGDSLILDIGSTTAYVARALRGHHDLFVVTNSVAVAQMLATRNNNRVFMAGGELRAHDAGAFGREAIAFLRQFSVQYAVLSAAAIDAETGFMLFDLQEAEFSREVIRHAERSIVAADATKFGRHAPVRLEDPGVIDTLVTDLPPPPDIAAVLEEASVNVVLAEASPPRTA
ncbi:MAG: DeoR/GlpR family DNA-binding transcription regulator [Kiloniellaceae bacterium]